MILTGWEGEYIIVLTSLSESRSIWGVTLDNSNVYYLSSDRLVIVVKDVVVDFIH